LEDAKSNEEYKQLDAEIRRDMERNEQISERIEQIATRLRQLKNEGDEF